MIRVNYADLKAATMCAATNDVRYYLNGVFFDEKGFIVSTDGHRLFCGSAVVPEGESKIVSIKGRLPTKFEYCNIDGTSAAFFDSKDVLIDTIPCEIVDGRFPDWRRVTSFVSNTVEAIGFNGAYLADACKIAKLFDRKFEGLKLEFQGVDKATRVLYKGGAFLVIMPMRL
nr:MAG TPA: DNA polymerase III, beta subunit [Caudoviricetes sp.]